MTTSCRVAGTAFSRMSFSSGAAVAQAQVVEQRLHDRRVARIADGAVVEVAHLAVQGLAQRAQAAGGVEGLVGDAVEGELLALLQRRDLAQAAVDDRLAGLAIFVDHPVGGPGEIVVQRVGRIAAAGRRRAGARRAARRSAWRGPRRRWR